MLVGLTEGFRPGHHGDFSAISHLSGPALRLEDVDVDFLADYAAADFEKGFLSPSFDKLLPGMHISPSYVVTPENQRKRGICDQSASGLNDGISREISRIRYDAQAELGALARWRKRRGDLDRPLADPVWWKSDVSGGFRNIPVHPRWQLKQVHRIRLRATARSKARWVYFVDQRLILGGRMSPRIFCTVLNLVLWAARRECLLEYPLVFVDDAFGLDASGVRVAVEHPVTKVTQVVPAEQAKLLLMWSFLKLPWDWKKQLHGTSLTIIGNLFSLTPEGDLTISLPASSVDAFDAQVEEFLGSRKGSAALREWMRVAGYANWAIGILPFGRFAIQCLYEKIAGKTLLRAGISINTAVRRDLRWFVKELREAPPLSLLDPALEHWAPGDADLVAYTDACLVADDGASSGLGFWAKIDGVKLNFFHRTDVALTDIRWAEALAIFSAINWALDNHSSLRRLLIFTDSALCVYAFDSRKVDPGPMHDLVWSTYARLARLGVDFRVRHISGKVNLTADFLSRALVVRLQRFAPHLFNFIPPYEHLGGPPR